MCTIHNNINVWLFVCIDMDITIKCIGKLTDADIRISRHELFTEEEKT